MWPSSNTTPAEYERMVERGQGIRSPPAISSRWCCRNGSRRRFELPLCAPTCALRRSTRRRFLLPGFRRILDRRLESEILVRVREGTATIRPLGGRAGRAGATPQHRTLEAELLADEKERAEHLMLLDLGRNDVGRVARTASGQGDRSVLHRAVQSGDAHRFQCRGQLDGNTMRSTRWRRAFRPAPSPGAPEVRAMEIIDELEQEKRGLYAGSVGYFLRGRRARQLYRVAHGADQGRRDVRSGRRRNRRRFQSQVRSNGNASTRPSAVPRCRRRPSDLASAARRGH